MQDYLALIFVGVILSSMAFIFKIDGDRIKKVMELSSEKRNGAIKRFLGLFYPMLSFSFEGKEVFISVTPKNKNTPPYTCIKYPLDLSRDVKISISPEGPLTSFGKKFGLKDIQVGNPELDEAYVIKSSDDMVILNYLSSGISEKFIQLKANAPILKIDKKSFSFSVPEIPSDNIKLENYITIALELIKKAKMLG